MELAGVPRTREKPHRSVQRFCTPTEAPTFPRKPRQRVAQFGVMGFDTGGPAFARDDFVLCFAGIEEVSVDRKAVAKIAQRFLGSTTPCKLSPLGEDVTENARRQRVARSTRVTR